MNPTRIEIDPNVVRDGLVQARLADADGPIGSGDEVVAFEPEDGVCWTAVAVYVTDGRVGLRVDDATMRDDDVERYWHEQIKPSSWWYSSGVGQVLPVNSSPQVISGSHTDESETYTAA